MSGAVSKATTVNPKDLLGAKKVPLSLVPSAAIAAEATAMYDGKLKYGAYNWRQKKVIASIYVEACKRHLDLFFEGQEIAEDSLVLHLGHARACLGILIDAMVTGNLVDDRPVVEGSTARYAAFMDGLSDWVVKRTEKQRCPMDKSKKSKKRSSTKRRP